jgi:hypothetical protein
VTLTKRVSPPTGRGLRRSGRVAPRGRPGEPGGGGAGAGGRMSERGASGGTYGVTIRKRLR